MEGSSLITNSTSHVAQSGLQILLCIGMLYGAEYAEQQYDPEDNT